jgi:hypothetical protein
MAFSRWMLGVMGAGAVAVHVGCSAAPEPTGDVEGAQARLDEVEISEPFPIGPYPEPLPVRPDTSEQACGPSACLYAYTIRVAGTPVTYGVNVTPSGERLSFPHHPYGEGALRSVVPAGDDFLVTFGTHPQRHLLRIEGSTGEVMEEIASPAFGYPMQMSASGGDTTLVLTSATVGVVIDGTSLEPVGPSFSLPFSAVRVVPGPEQYLVTSGSEVVRVDAATGALLDATPIAFNSYAPPHSIDGVYEAGVYILAWTEDQQASPSYLDGDVFASRIQPDGTVVDQDDHFNQLTGAITLCEACTGTNGISNSSGAASVHSIDGHVTVFWSNRDELWASRFDPEAGEVVHGDVSEPEAIAGEATRDFDLTMVGTQGFYNSDGYVSSLQTAYEPLSFVRGDRERVPYETHERVHPVVAFNGSTFLVVWREGNRPDWLHPNRKILASRLDPGTGAYLDDPPLEIGTGLYPAIVADGEDFLVAWVTYDYTIDRRMVGGEGSVGPVVTPPIHAGHEGTTTDPWDISNPRLVTNGKYYFLSWYDGAGGRRVRAHRLDAQGAVLDTPSYDVGAMQTGGLHTTIADLPEDITMGTFMTVFSPSSDSLGIRRIRSELGAMIEPVTTLDSGGEDRSRAPYGATDGEVALIGWREHNSSWMALVDPLSGTSISEPMTVGPTPILGAAPFLRNVWYDGRSFFVALSRSASGGRYFVDMMRFTEDLEPLDAVYGDQGRTLLEELSVVPLARSLAVAGDGNGRSLVVYQHPSLHRHGINLLGRFVDNDGQVAVLPPEDAGVAEDAGAEVDAGPADDGGEALPDAGAEADAGEASDAGAGEDAGAAIDAGADGGAMDPGPAPADAHVAPPVDAGADPDGTSSSGGCTVVAPSRGLGSSGAAWLIASLLLACWGFRRRTATHR